MMVAVKFHEAHILCDKGKLSVASMQAPFEQLRKLNEERFSVKFHCNDDRSIWSKLDNSLLKLTL